MWLGWQRVLSATGLPCRLALGADPELVNYLRNEFLRGEDIPWEAEVDLLLSELCSQVSYDLYAMDTQVRAYLLEQIKDIPFWQQRMREVAQVLISYVNFLSRVNPEQRQQELEAQRLAAMVYMGDETCQKAAQAIAERLRQLSESADSGGRSERGIRAELARLSASHKIWLHSSQQTPALIEYAKLVQRVLRNPEAVDPDELRQVYQVGDVAITVPQVFPKVQKAAENLFEGANFPSLSLLDFETGQLIEQGSVFPTLQEQVVEVVTLFFADEPAPATSPTFPVLLPFSFEIAIIEREQSDTGKWKINREIATIKRERSAVGKWKINRQLGEALLYEERLGNALSLEMVSIPAGRFMMGSPEDEPERTNAESPQHKVKINDFFMGRYPVTQAQWRFVAKLPQVERKLKPDPSNFKGDTRPVERVSWFDAVEFCDRLSQYTGLNYCLPTEAEWEYACRAGTTTPFHFGETISPELANYRGSATYNNGLKGEYRSKTTQVKNFGIANAFGLCDMHGNVWEWCQDHWHSSYKGAPTDGSAWVSKNKAANRLLRGRFLEQLSEVLSFCLSPRQPARLRVQLFRFSGCLSCPKDSLALCSFCPLALFERSAQKIFSIVV